MPCLLVLLALIAPRVVSIVLWIFRRSFFDRAFAGKDLMLIAGIVLLPFTTLAYAWAVNTEGGVHSTFFLVVVVIAAIADLSALEGGRRSRRG